MSAFGLELGAARQVVGYLVPCYAGGYDTEVWAHEGVVMGGSFTSGRFRFEVEASDWAADEARGLCKKFGDKAFDSRLFGTDRVPDLNGAPIASWILARLARLTDDGLALADMEHNDGGGYLVEFVAYAIPVEPKKPETGFVQPLLFDMAEPGVYVEPDKPSASFQFQADMTGSAVLGRRAADCPAEEVLEALADALLADPTDLACRTIAVFDPEWKE